jgi:hypothetical protein
MKKHLGKFVSIKMTKRSNSIEGLVIDYGDDWTLLKFCPVDFIIDGYCLLSNSKVLGFKQSEEEKFKEKVILLKGQGINEKDLKSFADFTTMIEAIKSKSDLVQIDLKHEDVSYIGLVKSTANDSLKIRSITPKGRKGKIEVFNTKDIWTIQFDNDYTDSLSLLIGEK